MAAAPLTLELSRRISLTGLAIDFLHAHQLLVVQLGFQFGDAVCQGNEHRIHFFTISIAIGDRSVRLFQFCFQQLQISLEFLQAAYS
jgi:hypothetical protein